jgi:hypothetical protein
MAKSMASVNMAKAVKAAEAMAEGIINEMAISYNESVSACLSAGDGSLKASAKAKSSKTISKISGGQRTARSMKTINISRNVNVEASSMSKKSIENGNGVMAKENNGENIFQWHLEMAAK